MKTLPLVIDNDLIDIVEKIEQETDLTDLWSAYKLIKRSGGSDKSMANNDRLLLMHHKPHLCFVDREMNIVKAVLWPYEHIYSMCWSATIDRFVVIERDNVFLVDENTLMIDVVDTIEKREWNSCTCSGISLFLTEEHASTVIEFSLLPSIELVKQWKSPQTCVMGEIIESIGYSNAKLALMIRNVSTKSIRIELRSADTFSSIWSLPLDIVCKRSKIFRFCSLTYEEWLVIDYENERLLHITKDGNMKATIPYDPTPHSVNLFGSNMLAVSRNGGIAFHLL